MITRFLERRKSSIEFSICFVLLLVIPHNLYGTGPSASDLRVIETIRILKEFKLCQACGALVTKRNRWF